jgi:hypothetical protein
MQRMSANHHHDAEIAAAPAGTAGQRWCWNESVRCCLQITMGEKKMN